MEAYEDILYCDVHINEEFTLDDLHTIIGEIHRHYSPPIDVILKRSSSYSVSSEAQAVLAKKIPEFKNFVYVVDTPRKKASAEFAARSYMKPYNTWVVATVEAALAILHGQGQAQPE
jgi:hypothetical protein